MAAPDGRKKRDSLLRRSFEQHACCAWGKPLTSATQLLERTSMHVAIVRAFLFMEEKNATHDYIFDPGPLRVDPHALKCIF